MLEELTKLSSLRKDYNHSEIRMPMEYILLQADDAQLLSQKVNKKLKEGWDLHGPPSVAGIPYGQGYSCYIQALTLRS